jgi:hypothetical protein
MAIPDNQSSTRPTPSTQLPAPIEIAQLPQAIHPVLPVAKRHQATPVVVQPPPKIRPNIVPQFRVSLVVFQQDGRVKLNINTAQEAKVAINELRLKKKEWAVVKREVMEEMRQIRAAYTEYTRQRGSKFPGGGTIGRMIRAFQTMDRDQMRNRLAQELAPLEAERRDIDSRMLEIDRAILEAQRFQ